MKKLTLIMLSILVIVVMTGGTALFAGSFNVKFGLFYPALDSDLWHINMQNLAFAKKDMQAGYYALEYEHFLGRYMSFAIEGGSYKKDHYSMYRDYEYDDGSPIYQNLGLRITSLEAGFKLYPMGHRMKFYPYVGGGAGIYRWKYEQWGDFIDIQEGVVNEDEYVESSAYTPGFNAKAGFVARLSRTMGISLEGRYQYLKGDIAPFFEGFEKLDMNGFAFLMGFNFFFR